MSGRLFSRPDPFAFAHSAAPPPPRPLAFIVRHLAPLAPIMAASLVLTVIGAALEVWLIIYAGRLVDILAASTPARVWADHGGEMLIAAGLVVVVRPLAALLREGLDDMAFRPTAETLIGWRVHRHVLGQPVSWFRADLAGRIATYVRDAAGAATGAAYAVLHTLSFVAVYIAGSVWLMATTDARLVWPLLVWIGLYLLLMAYVVPRYRRASGRLGAANSVLTGRLVDTYGNIDTVKLFARPAEDEREDRAVFAAAFSSFLAVQKLEVTMNAGMLALGSLLMAGLIGYGLVLWQAGTAEIGLVAAALALSFRITAMAEWLLDAMSALFGHLGTLRQALGTVAQPHAIADAPGAPALRVMGGSIRFDDITHSYGRGDGGLGGLTLHIAAGERVGLVGPSGAGKTTLVNLLLRFFEAESGSITIDGQDIGAVTQHSLRRQIALVGQDTGLLHRSVRDNIASGEPPVSDAAILAAARRAEAEAFIARLVDAEGRRGLDAHVGERGVTLSGGQRQRVAIARAILKDAPILILDEATSALDSEVEAAIQETLDQLMDKRTVIAIAHRLSTIARMDRIVVIDAGRVVEEGTHTSLLAAGGLYASLWARQ